MFLFGFSLFVGDLYAQTKVIDIKAKSFELDTKSKLVLAKGNVVVKHRDVVITGDRAKYNELNQQVEMFGNIKLTRDLMVLTAKNLTAYGLEDRIVANGDVKFTYDKIFGRSNFVNYDSKRQRIMLTGDAQAWHLKDLLYGDSIFIDLVKEHFLTKGNAKVIIDEARL